MYLFLKCQDKMKTKLQYTCVYASSVQNCSPSMETSQPEPTTILDRVELKISSFCYLCSFIKSLKMRYGSLGAVILKGFEVNEKYCLLHQKIITFCRIKIYSYSFIYLYYIFKELKGGRERLYGHPFTHIV